MKNKILLILTFLASAILLNSCLKDNIGEDWTSSLKGKMYAEIPGYGAQAFVIQPLTTTQTFKFLVNIATDALPTTDITLKFKIDTVPMHDYSLATQAADTTINWFYKLYPYITITDSIVTIKAGTRNAYVHVKIDSVKMQNGTTQSLTTKWMAPITMYSATGGGVIIASNKVNILYKLPIANQWEGKYAMSGYILRNLPPPDPALSGYYQNRVYSLGTSGANSVTFNDGISWAGNNGHVGGVGPWTITILGDNTITVRDPTNGAVTEDNLYNNRYDPALKTFFMSVYWGAGRLARATTDTLVYIGAIGK